jgi:hypothetical protein
MTTINLYWADPTITDGFGFEVIPFDTECDLMWFAVYCGWHSRHYDDDRALT